MKARDIIPGWPKGRTTSSSAIAWRVGDFVLWAREIRWREDGRLDKIDEMHQTIAYHKGQQRMVIEYLERWRTQRTISGLIWRQLFVD